MKRTMPNQKLTLLALLATTTMCPFLNSAESSTKDTFDNIWGLATLYSNKDNAFIQKLAFTGRLQYDYAYVDGDDLGDWDGWSWRRARVGFKATVFQNFTVHVESDLDVEYADPLHKKLTDAYVGWKSDTGWGIKVGKQSAGFTLDGATSSKSLITIERSKLSDNVWFTSEYFTGASVSGDSGEWTYFAGIFSNDNGDQFEDVGDAGVFGLFSVGYDFGPGLNVDKALLRVDYVRNEESDKMGAKPLSDVISVNGQYDNDRWHLWADLAWANAMNGNDIWGFEIMPFFDINETFQVVGQYTYVSSSDPNGVSVGRYEREVAPGRGDEIQTLYIGLNTYIYGHKLKWQNGFQLTEVKDAAADGGAFSGYGFNSAIRLSW